MDYETMVLLASTYERWLHSDDGDVIEECNEILNRYSSAQVQSAVKRIGKTELRVKRQIKAIVEDGKPKSKYATRVKKHECYCCFHFKGEGKVCRITGKVTIAKCEEHITIMQARNLYQSGINVIEDQADTDL